jgi:hypothetical protein
MAKNSTYAWYGYDINFDFSGRTSICNGLRFHRDSYAKNYVFKTSSKGKVVGDAVSIAAIETAEISLALLIPGFMHAALTDTLFLTKTQASNVSGYIFLF